MNMMQTGKHFRASDPAGTSFELASGAMFDPMNPDPDLMTIEDIATSLANTCRFGGHVLPGCFLSTAQHSVLVALLADDDRESQQYALLHDADEAFGIPDFLTPVKKMFPDVKRAQEGIGDAVAERFDLNPAVHGAVKVADRQALYLERMAVKHRSNEHRWKEWLGNAPEPEGIEVLPLQPNEAYDLFMAACRRVFDQDLPVTREWASQQSGFLIEPEYEAIPEI